nr:transposase [uncultured Porphyromonas sp.]
MCERGHTSPLTYDALLMFKILLLEIWYGLSDYEVQKCINDSLPFSESLGDDLG